jgi:acetyltransferase-like isoleucine patch superfamily enzyme
MNLLVIKNILPMRAGDVEIIYANTENLEQDYMYKPKFNLMNKILIKIISHNIFTYFFFKKIKNSVTDYVFNSKNIHLENDYRIDNIYNLKVENNILLNTGFKFLGKGKLTIGEGTYFAPYVTILTNTHDVNNMYELTKDVEIGRYCWIGANVTILPGVKISDFSVIGAESLVTKNTKPHSINYGAPCKYIKDRVVSRPYRLPKGIFINEFLQHED